MPAAAGGVLMTVSISGLLQVAFGSGRDQRRHDSLLYRNIVIRLTALAGCGAALLVSPLSAAAADGGAPGVVFAVSTVLTVSVGLVLAASLVAAVVDHALDNSDETKEASGADTAEEGPQRH